MKKSNITILFFILTLLSHRVSAQEKEIVSINGLFEIFTKISDNIDRLIDKQEAKRLFRHLDYFKNDMERYLIVRKEITNYLEDLNYSKFDTIRVQDAVLNLEVQIIKLGMRFETIATYANQTILEGTESFFDDIENTTQGQRVQFVNNLEALLNGESISRSQLKKDGKIILTKLKKSIELIDKIKRELKKKYQL